VPSINALDLIVRTSKVLEQARDMFSLQESRDG
jgi:hypothetical protein